MKQRIGRYAIQGKIGSGSSGTVYLALDPDLERRVAIKQLAPVLAGDPELLHRFRDEANTMARLNHPNCVKVFDFFEEDGSSASGPACDGQGVASLRRLALRCSRGCTGRAIAGRTGEALVPALGGLTD